MIFAVQFAIQSPVPPDSPMTESPGMFKPAQPPQAQFWVRTFPFMAFFFKAKLVDFLLRSVYKHLLKIVYCLVLILNEYYLEILLLAKFNEIMVKFIIRCVSNLCVYLLMCTKYIMCDQYLGSTAGATDSATSATRSHSATNSKQPGATARPFAENGNSFFGW